MSKPINILFVSSEVDPFAKTGGLADVSSSLPKAIKELGHEIRIMMPRYHFIGERKFKVTFERGPGEASFGWMWGNAEWQLVGIDLHTGTR